MNNKDIYNNKSGNSMQDAYSKLQEAFKIREASINGTQYDNVNGVELSSTPVNVNNNNDSRCKLMSNLVRVAGTVTQALRNFGETFLKLGEGAFIDAPLGLVGLINPEWVEEAIKFDITGTIMDWEENNFSINALNLLNNLSKKELQQIFHKRIRNLSTIIQQKPNITAKIIANNIYNPPPNKS